MSEVNNKEQYGKNSLKYKTILLFLGILVSYILQMAPAPILMFLKDYFRIVNNDALLNLSVSIIFPFIIIGCLIGGVFIQKLSLNKFYIVVLMILAAGSLINLISFSYPLFLIGRALYGFGFGMGIPFIGSAIMEWYSPQQREFMNTLNGLFPFIGTMISFFLMVPVYRIFGGSWQWAMSVWGIIILLVLLIWFVLIKKAKSISSSISAAPGIENGIYRKLLGMHDIRMLCCIFICDFFCYSYISVILPTLFYETGQVAEEVAGFWAAVAFPLVGFLGCFTGGLLIVKIGLRIPVLAAGQMIKFIGILTATVGSHYSFTLCVIGFSLFGWGNGMWMPVMYNIPMELPGMTPAHAGSAFGIISAFGFVFGFISPSIGGWITDYLIASDSFHATHAQGLLWSVFIFGFVNLISFICALKTTETGRNRLKEAKTA